MDDIKKIYYDITIAGGGPAGIACAYIAAKIGLKTLLIEKNNYLGGQITGALVVPMMKSTSDDIKIEFYKDLLSFSKKYNAQITYLDNNDGWFNPVLLKIVFDEMLKHAGADVLFESEIYGYGIKKDENNIDFIKIKSKTLSIHCYSKYFVDATGNSNLCEILNCNFIDDLEKFQPDSLRFIVSNIDLEKFKEQILKTDTNKEVTNAFKINNETHLTTAYTFDTNKNWGLKKFFDKAVKDGMLKYQDTSYFQVFTIPSMPGSLAFNCPRLNNYDKNDPFGASNALIEARSAIYRIYIFVKKYFNGFKNAYISQIADMTGIRVAKRPKTKYIYKVSDMILGKYFKNPVLTADYPIDIHSNEKNSSTLNMVKKYYLPIECLICEDYGNLFVAGRNVGAEFEAQAALRIQKSCISMGEGLAKYIGKLNSL